MLRGFGSARAVRTLAASPQFVGSGLFSVGMAKVSTPKKGKKPVHPLQVALELSDKLIKAAGGSQDLPQDIWAKVYDGTDEDALVKAGILAHDVLRDPLSDDPIPMETLQAAMESFWRRSVPAFHKPLRLAVCSKTVATGTPSRLNEAVPAMSFIWAIKVAHDSRDEQWLGQLLAIAVRGVPYELKKSGGDGVEDWFQGFQSNLDVGFAAKFNMDTALARGGQLVTLHRKYAVKMLKAVDKVPLKDIQELFNQRIQNKTLVLEDGFTTVDGEKTDAQHLPRKSAAWSKTYVTKHVQIYKRFEDVGLVSDMRRKELCDTTHDSRSWCAKQTHLEKLITYCKTKEELAYVTKSLLHRFADNSGLGFTDFDRLSSSVCFRRWYVQRLQQDDAFSDVSKEQQELVRDPALTDWDMFATKYLECADMGSVFTDYPTRVQTLFLRLRDVARGDHDEFFRSINAKYPRVSYEGRLHSSEMKEFAKPILQQWEMEQQLPHEEAPPAVPAVPPGVSAGADESLSSTEHAASRAAATFEEEEKIAKRDAEAKERANWIAMWAGREAEAWVRPVLLGQGSEALVETLASSSCFKKQLRAGERVMVVLEQNLHKEDHDKLERINPFFSKRAAAVQVFEQDAAQRAPHG